MAAAPNDDRAETADQRGAAANRAAPRAAQLRKGERFDHDPALKFGILPRLEPVASLPSIPAELRRFAKVGLAREMNKVRATLRAVQREVGRP